MIFLSMRVMIYYGVFNATRVSPYIDIGDYCVQNCTPSAKWSENVHGYPHSAYIEDTFVFSLSLNIYFIKNSLHLYFQLRY